jgi:Ca2+-binding RTX toxin-like protein
MPSPQLGPALHVLVDMPRHAALAILLGLLFPASALAGTARFGEVVTDGKYGYTVPAVFFSAAPGERNAITLARDGLAVTLRDAGATVQTGSGCRAIDAHTVVCREPISANEGSRPLIMIDAGDGDDAVTVPAEPERAATIVDGGAGADTLTGAGSLDGGPGRDVLTGGTDRDVLDGGGGDDVLRGSSGDDQLDGGGGDDRIDGGPGRDLATYAGRRRGVRVDLVARSATGGDGERDRLAGIEDVAGGKGADTLVGDERANGLNGGPGDDTLSGRGGDDGLVGGEGVDTMRGGDGNDSLRSHDRLDALLGGRGDDTLQAPYHASRPTARFRCGSGDDTVDGNPQGGLLVDCERVSPIGATFSARPRGDGSVRFGFACTARFLSRCSVTASLRRGSLRVAAGRGSASTRAPRSFLLRPRLRRGAVVQVVAAGTSIVQEAIRLRFAARWRIRL